MERIDPALVRLITERIDSVAHLELILLLHRDRSTRITAADGARAFGLSAEMAKNLLDDLCRGGFAEAVDGGFRYAPSSADLDRLLQSLATLYQQRPVTVIQVIYAQPPK